MQSVHGEHLFSERLSTLGDDPMWQALTMPCNLAWQSRPNALRLAVRPVKHRALVDRGVVIAIVAWQHD